MLVKLKSIRSWSVVALLLTLATPCVALADVLALAEARAQALEHNPGLAEMQARYEALTYVAPQQSTLPDPVISINAMNLPWDSFDRNEEPMTQMQLGISQAFPFPGKLSLREDIAVFEAEAALHSVEELRLNLDMNVAVTWWEIYFIDRALDTVRQNQSLLRQLVEVAQTKYEVGNGLQQDVLLAQLELSKLLDREITLTSMREQRAIRLNVLMGSSPNQPVELPTMVAQPDAAVAADELLYQRALASRPLLNQQSATLKAAESRLDLARKDYYPDFNLGVTYGQRDDDEMGQSRTDFLSVMLSVNIPLYAESRQSNAVSQRARELARNQYALLDQRNGVMSSISIAKSEYQRASAQIRLFGQGIIPHARQTVASMMGGYQVGQVDFLNLVRSQMTLFDYELQYWRAFTEVSQSIARLEAAVGGENIYE